jgi:hypothetical protein
MSDTSTDVKKDDMNMELPAGYTEVVQTRMWAVKEEGIIILGIPIGRIKKSSSMRADQEQWFYEFVLERPTKVVTGSGDNETKFVAKVGDIICIDEFAAVANWRHLLPDDNGNGHSVWLKFLGKEKLDQGRTMWKTSQGKKPVKGVKRSTQTDDIPF